MERRKAASNRVGTERVGGDRGSCYHETGSRVEDASSTTRRVAGKRISGYYREGVGSGASAVVPGRLSRNRRSVGDAGTVEGSTHQTRSW